MASGFLPRFLKEKRVRMVFLFFLLLRLKSYDGCSSAGECGNVLCIFKIRIFS